MAVIAEGFSVIIRKPALERSFPGGLHAYQRQLPNHSYCEDDHFCRVGFMAQGDAVAYAARLVADGMTGPVDGPSPDIAIVCSKSGLFAPCEWLELQVLWLKNGEQRIGVLVAKQPGEVITKFATPAGWSPASMVLISPEALKSDYELVKEERKDGGVVETYRHRQTGDLVHVGRPDVVQAVARYKELLNEINAIRDLDPLESREAAAGCLARATQLVEDTRRLDPAMLMMQGFAATLALRWDVAEQAFRAVTMLEPSDLHAWHSLIASLAELGRLDEAEIAARNVLALAPDHPSLLGNLANVLRQSGKLDEALATITRAAELAPGDNMIEQILDRIRNDRRKRR